MKHVRESLNQYYDYKFFKVFEEDEKAELQNKEKDGLAIIDKITKNFDQFKKDSKGEILKYKEFWEQNKTAKSEFAELGEGDVYKMFNSDYVAGVLTLPAETLSDGSLDGGMGATEEADEEIIEGPEIGGEEEEEEKPEEDFFEEQTVPNPAGAGPGSPAVNEADEEEDLGLDLGTGDEDPEGGEDISSELDNTEDQGLDAGDLGDALDLETGIEGGEEAPAEEPTAAEETPMETPMETPEEAPDLTGPQTYFVVYDISGDEREEIFRTGSNNVVKGFNAFYNDTFKGSMKSAIVKYKETKEVEKAEAEKSEKAKVQTDKQSKVKKFLGESKVNEEYDEYEDEEGEDISGDYECDNGWTVHVYDDLTATIDIDFDGWDSPRRAIHDIELWMEGGNDMTGSIIEDALPEGYCIDYEAGMNADDSDYSMSVDFKIKKCD